LIVTFTRKLRRKVDDPQLRRRFPMSQLQLAQLQERPVLPLPTMFITVKYVTLCIFCLCK